MLDKSRPFGEVHGAAAGAKWMQDGHYYSVDGRYLFSEPGVAPPEGETLRDLGEAEEIHREQEEMLYAASKNPPMSKDMARAEALSELSYFQLMHMVRKLKGPDFKGREAKKRMIVWLIDNQD